MVYIKQSGETIQHEYRLLERFEPETINGESTLSGAHGLLNSLNCLQLATLWAIVTSGLLLVASGLITARRCCAANYSRILPTRRQDARPTECIVVVEDAIAGIQSGLAAGYPVIAVNPPPETLQRCNKEAMAF